MRQENLSHTILWQQPAHISSGKGGDDYFFIPVACLAIEFNKRKLGDTTARQKRWDASMRKVYECRSVYLPALCRKQTIKSLPKHHPWEHAQSKCKQDFLSRCPRKLRTLSYKPFSIPDHKVIARTTQLLKNPSSSVKT